MAEESDPISSWFVAAEQLGEFIGIRFGQLRAGKSTPEWTFLRHAEVDGIGGLAQILRQRGADLPRLAQIRHPVPPSLLHGLPTWPKYLAPPRPLQWRPLEGNTRPGSRSEPPPAVAWHVFEEAPTLQLRRLCRRLGITVNSFLLKHLTKAIRPALMDEAAVVPWMIPVNLRGKVERSRDTENFSSYVGVRVRSYETVRDVHRTVYEALARGEHWANWYAYYSGRFLGMSMKRLLITTEKCTSQWSLGGFSNLGEWDADCRWNAPELAGPWFFCPPVLRLQKFGAGCITFQNRLSLTMQAHPELTVSSKPLEEWMANWVKEIRLDLTS